MAQMVYEEVRCELTVSIYHITLPIIKPLHYYHKRIISLIVEEKCVAVTAYLLRFPTCTIHNLRVYITECLAMATAYAVRRNGLLVP